MLAFSTEVFFVFVLLLSSGLCYLAFGKSLGACSQKDVNKLLRYFLPHQNKKFHSCGN
jgi:hypothetical protein